MRTDIPRDTACSPGDRLSRDDRLVTPFKELHIDETDIESLRWNRFKGMIASTPARMAMMAGAFLFGAGAGALALNPATSSTYPYCVMPLAVASSGRNRLLLAVIGILA